MKTDPIRIKSYFAEIRKNSSELNQLIDQNELKAESLPLKAAKYLLIELAEAMSNTIQHILAKEKGVAVSGYIDSVMKAQQPDSPILVRRRRPVDRKHQKRQR
ncbi:MAG: hypothetical protein ACYSWP_24545 [Planctomycetota bacterium]|jgi:uncharacterized protein YutE (UPF0331/DUF86 family)